MKIYLFTLIPLIILFLILSLDEAQVLFAMLTFGVGAIVAFLVVNALALMILAFPAIITGRVAGTMAGWGVFVLLVGALVFGPGLARRHLTADITATPPPVTGVLSAPAQSITLRYPNGYVAHHWENGTLAPAHKATPKQDIASLCDALCSGLLRLEGVAWVQVERPDLAPYRLRLDPDSAEVVVAEMRTDSTADLSISLQDQVFPENEEKSLQIWSGLQHISTREVIDHRAADQVVLARSAYAYRGVEDVTFFYPTFSTSLGTGIAAPWNWVNKLFRAGSVDRPDLASDLAAIGLPLAQGDDAPLAAGANVALLKQQVDSLLAQPIIPGPTRIEPFPEADRLAIYRFLTLFGETEPDAGMVATARALFDDPRHFDKQTVLAAMARTQQAPEFVAALLKADQTSDPKLQYGTPVDRLDDDQNRAVWRLLDADIGLAQLFDGATNRQREIYMRNLPHMAGHEIPMLEKAMGLAMDTLPIGTSKGPVGTTNVIRQAFSSTTKLPAALHGQAVPVIVGWLDRNIAFAQATQPNCHFLVSDAIKTLDKIGGQPEADAFLQRHNVTCPKR